MTNQTHKLIYDGKFSSGPLKKSFSQFLDGTYQTAFHFHSDYFLSDELYYQSRGFSGFCIIHCVENLEYEYSEFRKVFQKERIKWFYGSKNLLSDQMNLGDIWITIPRQGVMAGCKNFTEATSTLQNFLDQIKNQTR